MTFSRDSRRLACGFANGIVQQWDVHQIASDNLWQGWMSSPSSVESIAISLDGLKLAISSEDNELGIWSIETNGSDMIMYTLPNDDRTNRLSKDGYDFRLGLER
ncbi:uncharacterized protein LDX57_006867 [Aspergillus melleus]|uniref:uncharacterized protein n=1 Tax=Aspergillus melleus TaxID=138277 RepID=UPI001E8EB288|nr:uncharacterized protein LDX57_006867 [Aspergillus melleus]KAH8429198.1 hypothetical protein LDX57_006867 [Aspergillus melleus]